MLWLMWVHCACGMPQGDDASTTVLESEWFHAAAEMPLLDDYCQQWVGERTWNCVDVFSASQRFQKHFQKYGWTATSYDVKNNAAHDVTARKGMEILLNFGLGTRDRAFLPCAPPCSLFVSISQSVHRRRVSRLHWCLICALSFSVVCEILGYQAMYDLYYNII